MAQFKNTTVNDTGSITLPVGTNANRPASPELGMIRYNTELEAVEVYDGAEWDTLGGAPELTSLTYISTQFEYMGEAGTTQPFTLAAPSGAAAGDLGVLMMASDTPTSQSTPSGWTLLGNGTDSEYPKTYTYAKILESSDLSGAVSISAGSNLSHGGAFSVYRPDAPITSFTGKNWINSKGPSSYNNTTSASGVTAPAIAHTTLIGRTGPQTQELSMSPTDERVVNGGGSIGSYSPTIGYKIYAKNTSPVNISNGTNDEGRQSLTGVYIEVR